MKRFTASLFTVLVLLALAAAFVIPALAATTTTNALSYEFDNGNFKLANGGTWYWELQKNAAALNTTVQDYGYADAGVVVDLGLADNFTGITANTTGPMSNNIWIGDGTDAYTPGQYSSANFCYGLGQPGGSFSMQSGCGTYAYQTLTPGEIATDFAGNEVYAWVGLVYSGTSVGGSVSSVNGQAIGNRTVSLTQHSWVGQVFGNCRRRRTQLFPILVARRLPDLANSLRWELLSLKRAAASLSEISRSSSNCPLAYFKVAQL